MHASLESTPSLWPGVRRAAGPAQENRLTPPGYTLEAFDALVLDDVNPKAPTLVIEERAVDPIRA